VVFLKGGFIPVLAAAFLCACIAQKMVGVTFTESGKGVGIFSGQVDKTATAAPATIGSLVNTIGGALTLLEFTVKENGSRDGYPLQIKELRFTQTGTADIADLRFVLEGPGSNNTIGTSSGTTISFKDFGDIIVSDGDTTGKTYQVKVHVRSNIQGNIEDNSTILLKASPTTDFDVAETSSNFLQSVSGFQQNPATSVDIVGRYLRGKGSFQIGSVARNTDFPGTQTLYAEDANGRLDKDFNSAVTLTASTDVIGCGTGAGGAITSSDGGNPKNATQGIVSWTNLQYNQILTIRIAGTGPGITNPECTAAIDVTGP
jgi:hypothetical protein